MIEKGSKKRGLNNIMVRATAKGLAFDIKKELLKRYGYVQVRKSRYENTDRFIRRKKNVFSAWKNIVELEQLLNGTWRITVYKKIYPIIKNLIEKNKIEWELALKEEYLSIEWE